MEYFDTHAHYDDEKFNEDREDILNKIFNAGVTRCINMGCDIKSSIKAIKIAENHEHIIQKKFHKMKKKCLKLFLKLKN